MLSYLDYFHRYLVSSAQFHTQGQFASKAGLHGSGAAAVNKYLIYFIFHKPYGNLCIFIAFHNELHTLFRLHEFQNTGARYRFIKIT